MADLLFLAPGCKQLNNKVVPDERKFWKTVSLLFYEKVFRKETIMQKDNNRIRTNNQEVVEIFGNCFSNITQNLQIDKNVAEMTENVDTSDPVLKTINKYEKHPSIIKI